MTTLPFSEPAITHAGGLLEADASFASPSTSMESAVNCPFACPLAALGSRPANTMAGHGYRSLTYSLALSVLRTLPE